MVPARQKSLNSMRGSSNLGGRVPEPVVAHVSDPEGLRRLFEKFEEGNPGFSMGLLDTKGEVELRAELGGVRYLWVIEGRGEVYLPEGYRTKEGDGEPLPDFYAPDKLPEDVREALEVLRSKLHLVSEEVPYGDTIRNCVKSILDRWRGDVFVGDISGEVAQLTPLDRGGWCHTSWSDDEEVNEAIELIIERFDEVGWSTKLKGSYEALGVGDQVVVRPNERVKVRGRLRFVWIEDLEAVEPHTSTVRRVRHLKDLTGGCNIAFDPFRRLPLTWYVKGITRENPDGLNRVNSHVVNMAEEFSRTHYHPPKAIGGGKAQHELYLVLDPSAYGLRTYGRRCHAYFFPDLGDLSKYSVVDLRPGDVVYIPPGTGHRGANVLANVITLPGFKPQNEWYIDKRIKRLHGGRVPYNEFMIGVKSRYDVV